MKMTNYLIKVTEEWRVETVADADALEQEFRKDAAYLVTDVKKTEKVVKVKGEIVDEFMIVKVVKFFNDAKEPVREVTVDYH